MSSEFVFWFSLCMLTYIYVGYPILVYVGSRLFGCSIEKNDIEPRVSVVVAAYNEKDVIEETVESMLRQDYPAGKLEVVVVSDGSTDGTDQLVSNLCKKYPGRLRLLRQEPRAGKTSALNMAVKGLHGEVIVFADANSMYAVDAVRLLVRNFADRSVGYVTGKMIYVNGSKSSIGEGCSSYMRYENFLREQETGIGSVVGVDGGIDAIRKGLYTPMRADQLPDFVLQLKVVSAHHRVVYEPDAILREPALESINNEYKMRVRVALRALWAMWDMRHLFNVAGYGIFSVQLFSHKLLRYVAFIFLIALAASNLVLFGSSMFYQVVLILQIGFYVLAALGCQKNQAGLHSRIVYLPYYFMIINLASAQALFKFIRGEKQVIWRPRSG